jgi:LytS/YehU family sensor histidine kinase
MFRQWREALLNSEKLKREHIKSQLNALLHQLDPHFLFNSLNSLYAIIDKDTGKAKMFIKKFSDIYRYVLDVKGQLVIELNNEVKFLQEYYDLIEMRYGANLKLHIKINVEKLNLFIPPLSLQLLFENAVKHNVISSSNPLVVELYDEGEYLIMKNKIRRKNKVEQRPGMGLKNLTERYSYLEAEKPEFYIKNNYYIAKVPLIKDEN